MKSTWNDEESDGSQDEDNLVRNEATFFGTFVSNNHLFMQGCLGSIATDTICLSTKSDTTAIDSKSATSSLCDSDSNCGDESDKDNESLLEA